MWKWMKNRQYTRQDHGRITRDIRITEVQLDNWGNNCNYNNVLFSQVSVVLWETLLDKKLQVWHFTPSEGDESPDMSGLVTIPILEQQSSRTCQCNVVIFTINGEHAPVCLRGEDSCRWWWWWWRMMMMITMMIMMMLMLLHTDTRAQNTYFKITIIKKFTFHSRKQWNTQTSSKWHTALKFANYNPDDDDEGADAAADDDYNECDDDDVSRWLL